MRKIRVEDAVGEMLCHDMTAILENGFKGVRFKRGHVIREEDVPAPAGHREEPHIRLGAGSRRGPRGRRGAGAGRRRLRR